MKQAIVHNEGAAALTAADQNSTTQPATIKLGVDVHQARYVSVAQHDHATPQPPHRCRPEEFVPFVEKLLARGHRVYVVYEACGFGFGLCRQLTALGATCYVVAPCKLDERNTRVKTDALDAGALCQRLSRYVDGNLKELAVIRIPTEAEEQLRHIHRQREALVRARTKLQAQGRSLLVNHGQPTVQRWWRKMGWSLLARVVPAWLLDRLAIYRPVLEALDTQIATLTAQLEAAAPKALPTGLGKLTSMVVTREVCDWHRFKNRRQVSSYTGLCPGEYSSGSKRMPGAVTKHGNPRLRAALVELAWRLVRFQPGYPPIRERILVLAPGAKAAGSARKRAIVAVARQLAVDLWRYYTGQCTAEKLGLQS
jgi:transposase